jgi:GNAT superfamily N-acetyltransferase
MKLRVAPVTQETLDDYQALFSARGSPHYCWCAVYRASGNPSTKQARRQVMMRLIERGTPVGVLAYAGTEPIGWCSIAPRESYVKLERSRTMPRVSDAPTWVVLCFFVRRAERGQGVSAKLLKGALSYARAHGARLIEAYPYDSSKTSATHRGHSRLFAAAGFQQEGTRWFKTVRPRKPSKSR